VGRCFDSGPGTQSIVSNSLVDGFAFIAHTAPQRHLGAAIQAEASPVRLKQLT
jgi:hypothetical protein